MIFLNLLRESFLFAIHSLVVNKLRTILSLLGITIGIFAIISVLSVIDALENSIRTSIASLGDRMVYVQKWPWSMGSDYAWWEYMNRPQPKLEEMELLKKRSTRIEDIALTIEFRNTVVYKDNYAENTAIEGVTTDYQNVRNFEILQGRFFSEWESVSGRNMAVIGATLAEKLFQNTDPIGKVIKIGGRKTTIIGIIKKQGDDFFGFSMDNNIIIPITYAKQFVNIDSDDVGPTMWVKPMASISMEEFLDDLKGNMRNIRRLKPKEKDDFALNQTSIISNGFDQLFIIIDIAGIIIGGFSILLGGFGIANIMFVSVKEQTRIIGIQKALGAKKSFILQQFLYEASILSLLGGILGLLAVYLLVIVGREATGMNFTLSISNIILGLVTSVSIGVISGFAPAYTASRLNPVEAMSSV